MGIRLASILTVLVFGAVLLPAVAVADGDPASDVLLGENVFYPYQPPVSGPVQRSLNAATVAAKQAGFPIKVALIASPIDLGVIPELFGQPQKYADFLEREISFQGPQPLLVVMATGYGVQGFAPSAMSAAAGLPRPAGKTSNDLAQAAITTVAKLAAAAGHRVSDARGVSGRASAGASSSTTPIIIALILATALTAVVLILLRRRRPARPAGRVGRSR